MKLLFAVVCISLAAAMFVGPLPRFKVSAEFRIPRIRINRGIKYKLSFEDELQFIFNLKSQLQSGVNQNDAIRFAVMRAPVPSFVNAKQAMTSQSSALHALRQDALDDKFPMLIACVNLLEISAKSGSSINEALNQIAQSLINRRKQEQLIATELASTKATMFVLAGLPIVGAVMGLILGTDSITWLFGSTGGRMCLILGLVLELIGWLWVKKLLDSALAEVE